VRWSDLAPRSFFHPRQRLTELFVHRVGCALVPVGILSYLVMTGALLRAFDEVIRFTATRYAPIQSVPFGAGWTPQSHPLLCCFLPQRCWWRWCTPFAGGSVVAIVSYNFAPLLRLLG
jgi:hypothetical protein